MKNILPFISVFAFIVSCQNENKQPVEPEGQHLPSNVTIFKSTEHKYVFVVIIAEVPTLDKFGLVEWRLKRYFSDIIDVQDYNKDRKYQLMDSIQKTISINNSEFVTQVSRNIQDREKMYEMSKIHPKLLDRGVIESNSYHEASEKLSQSRMNESQSDGKIEPVNVEFGSSKSESIEKTN